MLIVPAPRDGAGSRYATTALKRGGWHGRLRVSTRCAGRATRHSPLAHRLGYHRARRPPTITQPTKGDLMPSLFVVSGPELGRWFRVDLGRLILGRGKGLPGRIRDD